MQTNKPGKAAYMKVVDGAAKSARPIDTSVPIYLQQERETDVAYEAFARYMRMPRGERAVARAAHELNKSISLLSKWSREWSWPARARARDHEQDEQERLSKLDAARKMGDRHAQQSALIVNALTQPALALMRKIQENPGLMADMLEPNADGKVPASKIKAVFEMIVRAAHALPQVTGIERLARGEPATIAEERILDGRSDGAVDENMLDPQRLLDDPEAAKLAGDLLARMSQRAATGTDGE
jgi:hypothetical protein